jgi:hypothetical protein
MIFVGVLTSNWRCSGTAWAGIVAYVTAVRMRLSACRHPCACWPLPFHTFGPKLDRPVTVLADDGAP